MGSRWSSLAIPPARAKYTYGSWPADRLCRSPTMRLLISNPGGRRIPPRSFITLRRPKETNKEPCGRYRLSEGQRRLESSLSEADVSHDGKRLTYFRRGDKQMQLVSSDRDGSN